MTHKVMRNELVRIRSHVARIAPELLGKGIDKRRYCALDGFQLGHAG
jgi:hypothetical protein